MQTCTANQRQLPYTSWTSWPPATQNPTGGFASAADIYPRTYSTTVFATPIKRTVEESQTKAVFPVSVCPPVSPLGKTSYGNRDLAGHRKPNCSYTVLIGMALKASKSGTLPVSEIYKYIQQEFPFFKTGGPDGWKNSVRHSLSLGQYFRKVERKDGYDQGKKGFHWEVVPEKKTTLNKEVERFLKEEGFVKIEMTAARAATSKTAATARPTTAVQSIPAKQILTLPLASVAQDKSSTAQLGLPSDPVQPSISSAESIGVTGTQGPAFSASNAQISQSSLEQLLSTLGTLDATSLQKLKFSRSDTQNLNVSLLNNNPATVTTANTRSLESIASTSNLHPTSAVIQQVFNETLPTLAEIAPTVTVVPELQTSTAPILPTPCQDLLPEQLNSTPTNEHSIQQVKLESISEDFPQPSTPIQPEMSSNVSILQQDFNVQKETGLPKPDFVAFADMPLFTSNNLCDNCKAVRYRIKQLASLSGVPLPEDTNSTAGNGFTPSDTTTPTTADKLEAEFNKQRSSGSDILRREVDRAIKLYRSTHPAPPQSATINDNDASTDNYYKLDSCNGNMRPMVDLGSLAATGCVKKSTVYVDMGYLSSQSPFINPTHPRANITLAELNQDPAASLDPHHSATAPYHTPSLLDDMDGTPHSDSFTRDIAPVYCDWNCWNDPEYAARMLQRDLEDFDEVLHKVTFTHEQEKRVEEERNRRLCVEEANSIRGDCDRDSTVYNQSTHTSGKWSPSCSDWNDLVENGERDLNISIPLTKVAPKSASKCNKRKVAQGKRRSRKRKLEDRDDVRGGAEEIQLKKKKKKYIPAMFSVFINSDESETDLD